MSVRCRRERVPLLAWWLISTRWGVSAEFVPYPAAGKVVADAGGEHWDIAFLAIDPAREATLRFTSPYITIQGCSPPASATTLPAAG